MNEYPDNFPDIRKRLYATAIRLYDPWYPISYPAYFKNINDPNSIVIKRDMPKPYMPKGFEEHFK